jgi:hypothetical protein
MHGTDRGNYYEMSGRGISAPSGTCNIFVLREEPADQNVVLQAQSQLVGQLASAGLGVADYQGGKDLTLAGRAGRSPDGWEYIELSGMLTGDANGRARVMLIVHGATVIPVIGVASNDNGCVGLLEESTAHGNTITWAALYHSMRINGAVPSDHFREQIVGPWSGSAFATRASAGVIQDVTFAPNGRYGGHGTIGVEREGPDESHVVSRHYTGDGRYLIEGNRLAIYPDRGAPQSSLVRIVEDYKAAPSLRTTVRLCTVKTDTANRLAPYESCLDRRTTQ